MFGLDYRQILEIIQFWGYPLMFLLMILEGPIVTLGVAFLASMGIFNIFVVLILSILGDIIGDIILYLIGYLSEKKIISKNQKFLRSDSQIISAIKRNFEKNGAKIVFFTKLTTGLCYPTFILAGITKLNFKKFLLFSFLGGIVWSSLLVILGFYFGQLAEKIENYIKYSGWIIFGIAIFLVSSIIIHQKNKAIQDYKTSKK